MSQQHNKRSRSEVPVPHGFRIDADVPSAYVCPLSWRIMTDPVLDPDDAEGHAVDREAFEQHQLQYGVRPLTGLPALPAVRTWKTLQGLIHRSLAAECNTVAQQSHAKCPRLSGAGPSLTPPPAGALPHSALGAAAAVTAVTAVPRPVLSLVQSTVPMSFFCPLSGVLMLDPVVDRRDPDATLERAALEAHVTAYGTNPLSGEQMELSDILPDKHLRVAISIWVERHRGPDLPLHTTPATAAGAAAAADATAGAGAGTVAALDALRVEETQRFPSAAGSAVALPVAAAVAAAGAAPQLHAAATLVPALQMHPSEARPSSGVLPQSSQPSMTVAAASTSTAGAGGACRSQGAPLFLTLPLSSASPPQDYSSGGGGGDGGVGGGGANNRDAGNASAIPRANVLPGQWQPLAAGAMPGRSTGTGPGPAGAAALGPRSGSGSGSGAGPRSAGGAAGTPAGIILAGEGGNGGLGGIGRGRMVARHHQSLVKRTAPKARTPAAPAGPPGVNAQTSAGMRQQQQRPHQQQQQTQQQRQQQQQVLQQLLHAQIQVAVASAALRARASADAPPAQVSSAGAIAATAAAAGPLLRNSGCNSPPTVRTSSGGGGAAAASGPPFALPMGVIPVLALPSGLLASHVQPPQPSGSLPGSQSQPSTVAPSGSPPAAPGPQATVSEPIQVRLQPAAASPPSSAAAGARAAMPPTQGSAAAPAAPGGADGPQSQTRLEAVIRVKVEDEDEDAHGADGPVRLGPMAEDLGGETSGPLCVPSTVYTTTDIGTESDGGGGGGGGGGGSGSDGGGADPMMAVADRANNPPDPVTVGISGCSSGATAVAGGSGRPAAAAAIGGVAVTVAAATAAGAGGAGGVVAASACGACEASEDSSPGEAQAGGGGGGATPLEGPRTVQNPPAARPAARKRVTPIPVPPRTAAAVLAAATTSGRVVWAEEEPQADAGAAAAAVAAAAATGDAAAGRTAADVQMGEADVRPEVAEAKSAEPTQQELEAAAAEAIAALWAGAAPAITPVADPDLDPDPGLYSGPSGSGAGGEAADVFIGQDAVAGAGVEGVRRGAGAGCGRREFTEQEVEALVAAVEEHGCKWGVVALTPSLLGRSTMVLSQKWRRLVECAISNGAGARRPPPAELRERIIALAERENAAELENEFGSDSDSGAPQGRGTGGKEPERRRYSDLEIRALLDGILEHGCDWNCILRSQRALQGRNEVSLKLKWGQLITAAARNWTDRSNREPPPADIRAKVAAALAVVGQLTDGAAGPSHQQQQLAQPPKQQPQQACVVGKNTPFSVPRELVHRLFGEHVRREKIKVQVQLNGVTLRETHDAILRLIAKQQGYQLVLCPTLRTVAQGWQIRGWEERDASDIVMVLATAGEGEGERTEAAAVADAGAGGAGGVEDVEGDGDADDGGEGDVSADVALDGAGDDGDESDGDSEDEGGGEDMEYDLDEGESYEADDDEAGGEAEADADGQAAGGAATEAKGGAGNGQGGTDDHLEGSGGGAVEAGGAGHGDAQEAGEGTFTDGGVLDAAAGSAGAGCGKAEVDLDANGAERGRRLRVWLQYPNSDAPYKPVSRRCAKPARWSCPRSSGSSIEVSSD